MNARLIGRTLLLVLVAAVTVAAEAARMTEEQRREHCLNNPCPGDQQPSYNWKTEQPFKRGGKWFVGPREYFSMDKGAFYWPSKTPAYSARRDFPEAADIQAGRFDQVAIEFFIEAKEQRGEMYELIERAQSQGNVEERVQLREGVEAVYRKRRPNQTYDEPVLYVATKLKTFAGTPPVVSCYVTENAPSDACTGGLHWRPGYRIYIRFNQRHANDWPEIYSEITRVLNLVEEK